MWWKHRPLNAKHVWTIRDPGVFLSQVLQYGAAQYDLPVAGTDHSAALELLHHGRVGEWEMREMREMRGFREMKEWERWEHLERWEDWEKREMREMRQMRGFRNIRGMRELTWDMTWGWPHCCPGTPSWLRSLWVTGFYLKLVWNIRNVGRTQKRHTRIRFIC